MNKTKKTITLSLLKLGFRAQAPNRPAGVSPGDSLVDMFLTHVKRLKPPESSHSPMRQVKRDTGQLDDPVQHSKRTWVDHSIADLDRLYAIDHDGYGNLGFTPRMIERWNT